MISEEKLYKQLQDSALMDQIQLEDSWHNEPLNEITYWFTAPKSLIEDEFPEADMSVICITVPYDQEPNPKHSSSEIWASRDDTDYDYSSVRIPFDFIEKLLEMVKEENVK